MKTSSSCNRKMRSFGVFAALCVLIWPSVPAFAYILPSTKAIVIQAVARPALETDSATRRDMTKVMQTTPALSPENIKKLAVSYLSSRIGDKVAVSAWGHGDVIEPPHPWSAMVLRIDYSVWPQEVSGKTVLIGQLAVHHATLYKGGMCFDRQVAYGPVDSFIVSDDHIQTQHNLEQSIRRLLSGYATIHPVPENE